MRIKYILFCLFYAFAENYIKGDKEVETFFILSA